MSISVGSARTDCDDNEEPEIIINIKNPSVSQRGFRWDRSVSELPDARCCSVDPSHTRRVRIAVQAENGTGSVQNSGHEVQHIVTQGACPTFRGVELGAVEKTMCETQKIMRRVNMRPNALFIPAFSNCPN